MFNDINNFFYRNIVVRYKEYQDHRDKMEFGNYNHTVVALELAETLFHFREQLDGQIRPSWKQVYSVCPDYRLITNAANAFKHGQLDHPDAIGLPLISKSAQIVEMTVSTFFTDESGEYSNNEKAIYANCTDGIERNFDQALANVMNYWLQFMRDIGEKDFGVRVVPDEPGSVILLGKKQVLGWI
ncbi:hypothetical protein [Asticcacaulis taihuensis]|uniref:Uncharacterized protein n=1 Tax=Asticcacaulis taihuensis TaxID=260084 RepID=A0A1G4T9F7_9CAUL|nr:hypothetical protein [Asticcacaulis taihuensis]SCW78050.1 hypothetical protein SAMN02927928_3343 [Asticcacaulis taihuensis]